MQNRQAPQEKLVDEEFEFTELDEVWALFRLYLQERFRINRTLRGNPHLRQKKNAELDGRFRQLGARAKAAGIKLEIARQPLQNNN